MATREPPRLTVESVAGAFQLLWDWLAAPTDDDELEHDSDVIETVGEDAGEEQ